MTRILVHHSNDSRAKTRDDSLIRKVYEAYGAWGMVTCLDLSECDAQTIRDADAIRRFVVVLCDHIKMKRFGETVVVNFGEDERVAGFSMTQLIETSLISAHFANQNNGVYLDVFSCSPYNPWEVAELAKKFFGASTYTFGCILRKA